jgi:hypothetical protein
MNLLDTACSTRLRPFRLAAELIGLAFGCWVLGR